MMSRHTSSTYRTFQPTATEAQLRARFWHRPATPELLTTIEAAHLAGMTADQLRVLRFRFPDATPQPYRPGNYGVGTLYRKTDVLAWIAARNQKEAA
jgi:hypothetical protein